MLVVIAGCDRSSAIATPRKFISPRSRSVETAFDSVAGVTKSSVAYDGVRDHDRRDARADGGGERHEVALAELGERQPDGREPVLRRLGGGAEAGEVLGRAHDPRALVGRDRVERERRHLARPGSRTPAAPSTSSCVLGPDVDDRREHAVQVGLRRARPESSASRRRHAGVRLHRRARAAGGRPGIALKAPPSCGAQMNGGSCLGLARRRGRVPGERDDLVAPTSSSSVRITMPPSGRLRSSSSTGAVGPLPSKPSSISWATLSSTGIAFTSARRSGRGRPAPGSAARRAPGSPARGTSACTIGRSGRRGSGGARRAAGRRRRPSAPRVIAATSTTPTTARRGDHARERGAADGRARSKAIFGPHVARRPQPGRDRRDEVRRHLRGRRRADQARRRAHRERARGGNRVVAVLSARGQDDRRPDPDGRRGVAAPATRARWTCCSPRASASRARWPRW